jgi:PleD family two-component response regulator
MSDPRGGKEPESLLKEADDAMYTAKRLGKGQYQTSPYKPLVVAT